MDSKLDLNLLVTFEALLAERNVSRAATRLGLSQPAVSAQLARLRDVFGDRLFVPAHRSMVPTARALELQEPLRAALDEVRGVVVVAGKQFDPARDSLTVKIAASDYVQCALLAPFAAGLCRRAPGIRIAALPLDGRLIGRQAELGDVDLAIMTRATAPTVLRHRALFDETYVCVARRHHPLVHGRLDLKTFLTLQL